MASFLVCGGNEVKREKKICEIFLQFKPGKKPESDPDTQRIGNQETITIEEIRILGHLLSLKPYETGPKIAIIPQAQNLTFEAQAALGKLLEEPRGETVLILACPHEELLSPLVVSRCQVINLPARPEISLSEEESQQFQEELEKILQSSQGERIKIVEKIGSREEAEKFCQIQLVLWRKKLLQNPNQKVVSTVREIQKTLKYLNANVNWRLALENLLLSFPAKP